MGFRGTVCRFCLHFTKVYTGLISCKSHPSLTGKSQNCTATSQVDLLVPWLLIILLNFAGGLGMNARLLKVPWNLFNISIISNGALSIVDLFCLCIWIFSSVSNSVHIIDAHSSESQLPDNDFLLKSLMRGFLLHLAISFQLLQLYLCSLNI